MWKCPVKSFFIYMIRNAKFAATGKADVKSAGTKNNTRSLKALRKVPVNLPTGRQTVWSLPAQDVIKTC
jgi:hypothetical protein